MTPREAEKLLGGFAAGTLTEAERKALFAAALEDQALFDSLADEEALRELLANPGARAHLLSALGKMASQGVPFWRRPAAMGLAASLLLAIGVGVLLRHVPVPESQGVLPVPRLGEQLQAPTPSAQVPQAAKAPVRTAPAKPLFKMARRSAPTSPPSAFPPPEPSANATAMADMAAHIPMPAPAPPGALAAPSPRAQAEVAAGEMRAEIKAKRSAESASADADFEGSTQGMSMSRESIVSARPVSPPPIWNLEQGSDGQFKLKVLWGPDGHLYVLSRNSKGVLVLAPSSTGARSGEKTLSLFSGTLKTQEALDLYLLPDPTDSPTLLPTQGPLHGFHARIWPPEKKTPLR